MPHLRRTRGGTGKSGARSEAWKQVVDENGGTQLFLIGDRPAVGCSMVVGSDTSFRLTSIITDIIEDTPNFVRFKTQNSEYEWWI